MVNPAGALSHHNRRLVSLARIAPAILFVLLFCASTLAVQHASTLNTREYGLLRVIDVVDVGDNGSEEAHGYTASGVIRGRYNTFTYPGGAYIVDDYRLYDQSEAFTVDTYPGRDTYLVKRFATIIASGQAVEYYVNGQSLGVWAFNDTPLDIDSVFRDSAVRIGGELIPSDRTELKFVYSHGDPGIVSYRYWVCVREDNDFWVYSYALAYSAAAFLLIALSARLYSHLVNRSVRKDRILAAVLAAGVLFCLAYALGGGRYPVLVSVLLAFGLYRLYAGWADRTIGGLPVIRLIRTHLTMKGRARVAGLCVLIISLSWVHWMMGSSYALAFLAAFVILAYVRLSGLPPSMRFSRWVFLLAVFLFTLAVIYMISSVVFRHYPEYEDEITYIFQAKVLKAGRLYVPATPYYYPVSNVFIINEDGSADGKRFGKYPVGHPLVLALSMFLGAEWVLPLILAASTVIVIYFVGREMFGGAVGTVACVLCASSQYFLLMSSTLLSHVSELFFLAVFTLFYVRAVKKEDLASSALAGVSLGMALLARPYTAAAYSLPFVVYSAALLFVHRMNAGSKNERLGFSFDRGMFRRLSVIILMGCVFVLVMVGYNKALTGDYLVFPFTINTPQHHMEFHLDRDCKGNPAVCLADTVLNRLSGRIVSIRMLDDVLLGWPITPFLFVFILFVGVGLTRWDYLLGFGALSIIVFHAFYNHPGVHFIGPVYYYETLLPLLLLVSRGVVVAYGRLGGSIMRRTYMREAFAALMVVLFLSGYGSLMDDTPLGCNKSTANILNRCSIYEIMDVIAYRRIPLTSADSYGLHNAIVFVDYPHLRTWAYAVNSPFLDDDVLFFQYDEDYLSMVKKDFPDRGCYIIEYAYGNSTLKKC
jgi:hypothetical protein